MAHILAIANQKGGVGKTTTSVNLAAAFAHAQRRVLLVDLDPQGNATMGSGVNKKELTNSINEVLLGEVVTQAALITTTIGGYALLPSNGELTAAEVALLASPQREQTLRHYLHVLSNAYDYILLDCPPSLNMLTLNGLVAAKQVLIPVQCEYYALEGLTALVNTIAQLQQTVNSSLEILGLLRTLYDPRNKLAQDVSDQLQEHFGSLLFTTAIPRNIRLAEAPSHGLPIVLYDKLSRGSIAYLNLAAEILNRL